MAEPRFQVVHGALRSADSDAALVEALRRGDRAAELAAWNRFAAGADATLRRLLGPGSDVEDLLQEVFVRFFRRVGTIREPGAVRGFLTMICVRVVQQEISRRRRRAWLRLTDTGDVPDTASPAIDQELREAMRRYYRLLDRLGGKHRSLFVAHTIEGLTLDAAAAAHGVSVSTAQRHISRARARVAAWVRRDPMLVELFQRGGK